MILGFGINTNYGLTDFPKELKGKATSLKIILNREINGEQLMKKILERIEFWYNRHTPSRKDELITKINEHSLYKRGEKIKLKTSKGFLEANYEGIVNDGALLIHTNYEKIKIYSGQIIR